jgi:hypothetical protein
MLPGQSEHRLTEGRQGRWLYELEQALLLKSEKKPVTAAPERAAVSEQAATPELATGGTQGVAGAGTAMAAASGGHGASAQLPTAATAAATAKAEVDVEEAGPAAAPVASATLGSAIVGAPAPAALVMAVDQPGTMTATPALSLAAYAAAGGSSQRPAARVSSAAYSPPRKASQP